MHNAQYVQCNRKEQSIAAGAENQHIHTICNATDRSRALQLELSMRESKQQVQQSTAISVSTAAAAPPNSCTKGCICIKGNLKLAIAEMHPLGFLLTKVAGSSCALSFLKCLKKALHGVAIALKCFLHLKPG